VVDSNPNIAIKLKSEGVPFIFGDVTTSEVLEKLNFQKIDTVFSSVPDTNDNEMLIHHINEINPKINFIAIVDSRGKANQLYELGAHYVLITYMLAGAQLIRSKGEADGAISLDSMLKDLEGLRKKGKEHKKTLYDEPWILHSCEPKNAEPSA
jgi:Trk K+ transport system NAD-binding subunit